MACNNCKKIRILIENNEVAKKLLFEDAANPQLNDYIVNLIINKFSSEIKTLIKQNARSFTKIVAETTTNPDENKIQEIRTKSDVLYKKIVQDRGLLEDIIKSKINPTLEIKAPKLNENVENDNEQEAQKILDDCINIIDEHYASFENCAFTITNIVCFLQPLAMAVAEVEVGTNIIANQIIAQQTKKQKLQSTPNLKVVDQCPTGESEKIIEPYAKQLGLQLNTKFCVSQGGEISSVLRPSINEIKIKILNNKQSLLKEARKPIVGLDELINVLNRFLKSANSALKGWTPGIVRTIRKFTAEEGQQFVRKAEEAISNIDLSDNSAVSKERVYEVLERRFKLGKDAAKQLGDSEAENAIDKILKRLEKSKLDIEDLAKGERAARGTGNAVEASVEATKKNLIKKGEELIKSVIDHPVWQRPGWVRAFNNSWFKLGAGCSAAGYATAMGAAASLVDRLIGAGIVAAVLRGIWHVYSMVRISQWASGRGRWTDLVYTGIGKLGDFFKKQGSRLETVKTFGSLYVGYQICKSGYKSGLRRGTLDSGLASLIKSQNKIARENAKKYNLTDRQLQSLITSVRLSDKLGVENEAAVFAIEAGTTVTPFILPLKGTAASLPSWIVSDFASKIWSGESNPFYNDYDRYVDEIDLVSYVKFIWGTAIDVQFAAFTGDTTATRERAELNKKEFLDRFPQSLKNNLRFLYAQFEYQYIKNKDALESFKIIIDKEKGIEITGAGAYILCTGFNNYPEPLMNQLFKTIVQQKAYFDNVFKDNKPDISLLPREILDLISDLFGGVGKEGGIANPQGNIGAEIADKTYKYVETDEFKKFFERYIKFIDDVSKSYKATGQDTTAFLKTVKQACSGSEAELKKITDTEYDAPKGIDLFTYLNILRDQEKKKDDLRMNPFYQDFSEDFSKFIKVNPKDDKGNAIKGRFYYVCGLIGSKHFSVCQLDDNYKPIMENGKPVPDKDNNNKVKLYDVDKFVIAK